MLKNKRGFMKFNKKILVMLLFVFVVAMGSVVAADSANTTDDLNAADSDDKLEVAPADDELAASSDDPEGDALSKTEAEIEVKVLDKNPKVGDKLRVQFTVKNTGVHRAPKLTVGMSFSDIFGNPDPSVKLYDFGTYDYKETDGGFVVDFGEFAAGESRTVICLFKLTGSGKKVINANVDGPNVSNSQDSSAFDNDTFTVSENPAADSADSSNNEQNLNSEKTAATGNPIVVLLVALLGLGTCYRKK